MIAEKGAKTWRFQCKALTPKNGALELQLVKYGPKYSSKYETHMFDMFSVYDLNNDKIYFVNSNILETHKKQFTIRLNDVTGACHNPKNHASEYLASNWLTTI